MNAIRIRTRIESETLTLPELKSLIGRAVEIIVLEEQPLAHAPLETRDTMFGLLPPKADTPELRAAEMAELREMAKNDANLARFLDLHDAGVRIDVDAIIAARNAEQV